MNAATKRKLVWGFVVILAVVHYDFWFWTDTSLWFGFMPVGLGFHALISLMAGIAWALVVKFAWPTWIEEWAGQQEVDLREPDLRESDHRESDHPETDHPETDHRESDQQEAGPS